MMRWLNELGSTSWIT